MSKYSMCCTLIDCFSAEDNQKFEGMGDVDTDDAAKRMVKTSIKWLSMSPTFIKLWKKQNQPLKIGIRAKNYDSLEILLAILTMNNVYSLIKPQKNDSENGVFSVYKDAFNSLRENNSDGQFADYHKDKLVLLDDTIDKYGYSNRQKVEKFRCFLFTSLENAVQLVCSNNGKIKGREPNRAGIYNIKNIMTILQKFMADKFSVKEEDKRREEISKEIDKVITIIKEVTNPNIQWLVCNRLADCERRVEDVFSKIEKVIGKNEFMNEKKERLIGRISDYKKNDFHNYEEEAHGHVLKQLNQLEEQVKKYEKFENTLSITFSKN